MNIRFAFWPGKHDAEAAIGSHCTGKQFTKTSGSDAAEAAERIRRPKSGIAAFEAASHSIPGTVENFRGLY